MDTEISSKSGTSSLEGSAIFPSASGKFSATSASDVEKALGVLQTKKGVWAKLNVAERVVILDKIKLDLARVTEPWIEQTLAAKGIPPNSFGELEEWVLVAALFRMLRVLRRSLLEIERYGQPRIPGSIRKEANGHLIVPAFPQTLRDRIVYPGVRADIWMEPDVSREDVKRFQAKSYRKGARLGEVVVVLGAGNLGILPIGDFMHKLFVEKNVVILKVSPVNDYIGPLIEKSFAALIARGFLQVVYGGSDVGAHLCNHRSVDAIHMTGSDKTFEAIVFGTDSKAAYRKANQRPLLDKPITGELGNVSPVIVVPGEWNDDDVRVQAARLASWLSYNAGCNCNTPRVIIQHKDWDLRDRMVGAIADALDKVPTRKAYYPGSVERHRVVLDAHPNSQLRGETAPDHLPWTFVTDIDPRNSKDICFRSEPFYGQFGETAISAANIPEFIDHAVAFANGTLWGNLAATIIVHPRSLEESRVEAAFERAIANLKYGTVCVNFHPGVAYTLWTAPAGPFSGNEICDIQSGIGSVNNYLMLEHAQKSVFRAPFKSKRDPSLFTCRNMDLGRTLVEFEATPSLWNLSRLGIASLRS